MVGDLIREEVGLTGRPTRLFNCSCSCGCGTTGVLSNHQLSARKRNGFTCGFATELKTRLDRSKKYTPGAVLSDFLTLVRVEADRSGRRTVVARCSCGELVVKRYGGIRRSASCDACAGGAKTYVIDGKPITSSEVCRKFGVLRSTFLKRISSGMTPEDAAKTPVRGASGVQEEFVVAGEVLTASELAELAGLSVNRVSGLMASGHPIESILRPKTLRKDPRHRLVEIDGVLKPIGTWCHEAGIRKSTVFYRMGKGMSLKEALSAGNRKAPGGSR